MRASSNLTILLAVLLLGWCCAPCLGQYPPVAQSPYDAITPETQEMPQPVQEEESSFGEQASAANLEGCQRIATIDNQIVLACDVLWRVNMLLESQLEKFPKEQHPKPEEIAEIRQNLVRQEIARLLDQKLVYDEFRRNVPAERLPTIEENLRQPFEEHEVPQLMERLKVDNMRDLELEIARLGSSLADVRRAFTERVIVQQWIKTKIEVNEEVTPDEMIAYYQSHLTDYDYPTQARWEELMVRKNKYRDPREAFAAIANLGNEVWQRGNAAAVRGPAFAEIAKAKSDGFTAKDGGEQKWTTQGALKSKVIDDALFRLEVGQMSPILETETGFHIVRVLERKDAGRRPFTDVQGDIRKSLKDERFQAGVEAYLAKLRKDARIWTVYTGYVSADQLMTFRPEAPKQR